MDLDNAKPVVIVCNDGESRAIGAIVASIAGSNNYQLVEDPRLEIPFVLSDRVVVIINCHYSEEDKKHMTRLARKLIEIKSHKRQHEETS